MAVAVPVGVAVGVGVSLGVGVVLVVADGVTVGVAVAVGVSEGVLVGLLVGVPLGVPLGLCVGVVLALGFGMQSDADVDPVPAVVSTGAHASHTVLPAPAAYSPIPHAAHTPTVDCPAALPYRPATHCVQSASASAAALPPHRPAGHAPHVLDADAPTVELQRPAVHAAHTDSPVPAPYRPAAQLLQSVLLAAENLPVGHVTQVSPESATVPAAHALHVVAPAGDISPLGQDWQLFSVCVVSFWKKPAAQVAQAAPETYCPSPHATLQPDSASVPSGDVRPSGHALHLIWPAVSWYRPARQSVHAVISSTFAALPGEHSWHDVCPVKA